MKLLRSSMHACVSLQFFLGLVLSCLVVVTAQGQELVTTSAETTKVVPTETAVSERLRLLEGELERQNNKLELLQKTIEEQQQAIQTLMAKLSADKTPIQNAKDGIIAAAPAVPTATTSNGEPQTPSLEQRVAKVEGQVLKAGPFRLSGDFRLRMDATFRSASEPPNPALAHLQNVRARYRLRLNFDTDLYPSLSFHGQLATGA